MTSHASETKVPHSQSPLVVVGSIAYDSVKTPMGERNDLLGGSATYFSMASSVFSSTSMVGVVGEDFRPSDIALLEKHKVDISGLKTAPGQTFRWGGSYHEDMNGRDTLFTELNVFESFSPELSQAQKKAEVLFLGNILPKLQSQVLDQVEKPRFVAIDTMNLWITNAKEDLLQVLSRVDAFFLNDEEARQLTGKRSVVLAARDIQAMGPSLVVIKRGEHGAMVFNEKDCFFAPAYPLERVVDPTGAGDTFAGAFIGYLSCTQDFSNESIRQAAILGSIMASFCVEGYGMERLKRIDRDAIMDRYKAFKALTHFGEVSW